MVIYLDMPVEKCQELMLKRYNGDESKKDIHERNVRYLEQSAKAAAYCAGKLGWKIVRCSDGEKMRSVIEIRSEIYSLLNLDVLQALHIKDDA